MIGYGLFFAFTYSLVQETGRLCGLVVRVFGYRSSGPGFDSRHYTDFSEK
jgi:hypothetical protein